MTTPNSIRTGSVQVKYTDGTEHTLPIHGITQLQLIRLIGEAGIKSLNSLIGSDVTFDQLRVVNHVAAAALSFEKTQDIWNLERIENSFADMQEVTKVFMKCIELSHLPQASTDQVQTRKQTPYH